MRHPLVPALLLVLALLGYAVLGAVVVDAKPVQGVEATQSGPNATVAGTVTDEEGRPVADAYVLLESAPADRLREATGGDRDVAEYLLRFGMAEVDDVRTVRTDDDGRYRAEVRPGTYAVVAVTDDFAVSDLRDASADGDATVDLSVDPDRVQELRGDRVTLAPGNETSVTMRLRNTDDEPIRSLAVAFGDLPDGWTVESVTTGGNDDPVGRTVTWNAVEPDETVSVEVTIDVPPDAEPGRHAVDVSADAESHFVERTSGVVVQVEPPGWTPTATHTNVPVSNGNGHAGTDADRSSKTDRPASGDRATDTPAPITTTAPGFGLPLAVLVFALVAVAGVGRTDRR